MLSIFRFQSIYVPAASSAALIISLVLMGCGGGGGNPSGNVLIADAEFNPDTGNNAISPIHETELALAQTFTVEASGRFERFQVALAQGAAGSEGTVRVDVRPVVGGIPEPDDAGSIITPIDIDTTTLPGSLVEEFTVIDVGEQPNREVMAGEEYAIVVTFLSRSAGAVDQPIATLLGRSGDEFVGGTGSSNPDDTGFVNVATDYFFRTFVLQAP